MLIDLSVKVTKSVNKDALDNEKAVSFGHLGTHFDVMNKEFPLDFTRRRGLVFDVSGVVNRDIEPWDLDLSAVEEGMFVALCSGFIEREEYGTKTYFVAHPQLSHELIDRLLDKKISIIGIDFAGVRRGAEHSPKDQYCADRGVFIVENLTNLTKVLNGEPKAVFTAHTYPIHFADMSGLPCRVVAEL